MWQKFDQIRPKLSKFGQILKIVHKCENLTKIRPQFENFYKNWSINFYKNWSIIQNLANFFAFRPNCENFNNFYQIFKLQPNFENFTNFSNFGLFFIKFWPNFEKLTKFSNFGLIFLSNLAQFLSKFSNFCEIFKFGLVYIKFFKFQSNFQIAA